MTYKSSFNNFLENSNEKKKEIALLRKLLTKRKFNSLLDIGAGTGEIAQAISNNFKNIDLIEMNGDFVSNLENSKMKLHYSKFEDISFDKKYDFVIACHVLPYLRNNNFYNNMDKVFDLLNKKGCLVSFEMTTEGHLGMIKEAIFKKKIKTTYEYLVEYFQDRNVEYKEKKFKVELVTVKHKEMFEVLRFFAEMYRNKFTANSDFINRYISDHLYCKDEKLFKLNFYNKMMIANKS